MKLEIGSDYQIQTHSNIYYRVSVVTNDSRWLLVKWPGHSEQIKIGNIIMVKRFID